MIITPTEDDVFRTLRAFLQDVLGVGFEVIVGQENRVPEPTSTNYVVMWPIRMPRLSTNREELAALGLELKVTQSSQVVIQLDVHGEAGFNNSTMISTMFRSSYAVQFFADRGDAIAPLFADDPRQMPFNNAEQQVEDRYVVEANLQVNQTVTADTTSARELVLGITSVETDPANWPNSTITVTP